MGRFSEAKLMDKAEIPAFVDAVIAAGCDIRAIDDRRYVIGDLDFIGDQWESSTPMLAEICREFGDRDFLTREICLYLHSIGRISADEDSQLIDALTKAQKLTNAADDSFLIYLIEMALMRAQQRRDEAIEEELDRFA